MGEGGGAITRGGCQHVFLLSQIQLQPQTEEEDEDDDEDDDRGLSPGRTAAPCTAPNGTLN